IHTVGVRFPTVLTPAYTQHLSEHKTYFVCQTFGKADGFRMSICLNQQVDCKQAQEWISGKMKTEPGVETARRKWEAPYIYSLVQTDDREHLAKILGGNPVWDEIHPVNNTNSER